MRQYKVITSGLIVLAALAGFAVSAQECPYPYACGQAAFDNTTLTNDSTSLTPAYGAPSAPAPPPPVIPPKPAPAATCASTTFPATSKASSGLGGSSNSCTFASFTTGSGSIGDTFDQPSGGVNSQPRHYGCDNGNQYSVSHTEGEEIITCTASGWSAPVMSCACLHD